jgi:hypothetical protein
VIVGLIFGSVCNKYFQGKVVVWKLIRHLAGENTGRLRVDATGAEKLYGDGAGYTISGAFDRYKGCLKLSEGLVGPFVFDKNVFLGPLAGSAKVSVTIGEIQNQENRIFRKNTLPHGVFGKTPEFECGHV